MIQQLRIQNFKSLRDVTLDLQRVNLLIGPNNCGKTNVLKALSFFSNALEGKYPPYERMAELGYRYIEEGRFYTSTPFSISFSNNHSAFGALQVMQPRKKEYHVPYCIIAGTGNSSFYTGDLFDITAVDKFFSDFEACFFWENTDKIVIPEEYKNIRNSSSSYSGLSIEKFADKKVFSLNVPSNTPVDAFEKLEILLTFSSINNLLIYHPDPSKLLEPYPSRPEEGVDDNATNLIAFFREIQSKYPDIYDRIIKDLQRFVPEYIAISSEYVDLDENDVIRTKYGPKSYSFYKLGLIDKHKRTFWAEDLSEGILYFLALLAIIHQPNPPKLLLLEEPEKGIHPRRIREVLDLIFELAEEKDIQVIMTTHSPLVVDRFSDIPESVFILEKPENETIVKNLQRDVIEPMNEKFRAAGEEPIPYTEALGEHWAMGFLGGVPYERF